MPSARFYLFEKPLQIVSFQARLNYERCGAKACHCYLLMIKDDENIVVKNISLRLLFNYQVINDNHGIINNNGIFNCNNGISNLFVKTIFRISSLPRMALYLVKAVLRFQRTSYNSIPIVLVFPTQRLFLFVLFCVPPNRELSFNVLSVSLALS